MLWIDSPSRRNRTIFGFNVYNFCWFLVITFKVINFSHGQGSNLVTILDIVEDCGEMVEETPKNLDISV